ncbi:SDR family oxidoreductase [Pseudoduganella rhizocola]|uniref:SDR family oxidoreductase n=1 Tax=Pseudoduganella rhizocola TaxID=3382643 RepID=UPI0038B51A81
MIVVTGATGELGKLVVEALLKRVPAGQIVAAVRDPAKAGALAQKGVAVRRADYTDRASLEAAFAGAEKVLLISSSEVGQRLPQHLNVVAAAERAGVKLLAYTSVLRADTSPMSVAAEHKATEEAIRASGLPFAFLRNGWYLENYAGSIAGAAAQGVLAGGSGDGRIAAAARADYAEAAAAVLVSGAPQQVYELGGDMPFTLGELAAEVARQSGREVKFLNLPQAEYEAALLAHQLPPAMAALIADADANAAHGALDEGSRTLSKLIGHPTRSLADAVKAVLAA